MATVVENDLVVSAERQLICEGCIGRNVLGRRRLEVVSVELVVDERSERLLNARDNNDAAAKGLLRACLGGGNCSPATRLTVVKALRWGPLILHRHIEEVTHELTFDSEHGALLPAKACCQKCI